MASRDFLGGFGREGGEEEPEPSGGRATAAGSDDIELGLGLSLGGCFGADPAAKKPRLGLVRSSSIASICSLPGGLASGDEPAAAVTAPPMDLLRTSSLPTEYMEDRLRRRAMQSQRRLEAKRKRLERRNSMNSGRSVPNTGAASCRDEAMEQTVASGFQYRRTVALQGTTSSSLPDQGSGSSCADEKNPPVMNTSSDNSGSKSSSRPPTASGTGRPSNGSTGREPPPLRTLC